MKLYFYEFSLPFFGFLLINLKSYTFRIHSSIILKDFQRRLRAKTIQMFDFSFVFVRGEFARVSARVYSKTVSAQLKLREIAAKRLKVVL